MRFRIDLKIFIFLIIFYFTKQIEIYVYLMLFAFIHEIGHLIAGLALGMKPEKIEIMPFGFSLSFKTNVKDFNKKIKKGNILGIKKIIVAFAGPFTNLIIILITSHINIDIIKQLMIIYTNFLIFAFNLIPIYPLDGGRILKEFLHINFGIQKTEKMIFLISNIVLLVVSSLIIILAIYTKNFAYVLVIGYLWLLVIKENLIYKRKQLIYKKILENKSI